MRPGCIVQDVTAFEAEARAFAESLAPGDSGATLITLSGDLGAGKTTFTQTVARTLGVTEPVTSPTFVLAKSYALSEQSFTRLVHIDAYRLTQGSELSALGFPEILKDTGTLIMFEWPEKIADALPTPTVRITLSTLPDLSRSITYA